MVRFTEAMAKDIKETIFNSRPNLVNMIKAVSFDIDGTLVYQRREYIYSVIRKTLLELGVPYDEEFALEFWYGGDRDGIIQRRLGVDCADFWRVFRKHDNAEERVKNTEVYEDVTVLRSLRAMGMKIGLVTGSIPEIANAEISKILEKVGDIKFDSIVTNDPASEIRPKPFPDGLLKSLRELNVKSDELIYVGNGLEDVEAAVQAGVRPIIILRDENPQMDFGKDTKVICSLYDLERIVLEI